MAFKDPSQQLRAALARGVSDAAEHVLAESNKRVPVDPGTDLQRSGQVSAEGLRAAVSYGRGESADYAVVQHENLTFRHDPGRTAKFLENAADAGEILKTVADSLREALR